MNEQTVSDERIAEIEHIANRWPPLPGPGAASIQYDVWNADISAWRKRLASYNDNIAAICRELLASREADRLAEIAKRVPSDEELRLLAGGGE